jgi:hypothetical protein
MFGQAGTVYHRLPRARKAMVQFSTDCDGYPALAGPLIIVRVAGRRVASGIEARRVETQGGSVYESPAPKADAQIAANGSKLRSESFSKVNR